ncbi:MAG: Catechol-2,3-dioxygenase [Anaerolineales bacterium]|nr:Catechol-2,3-dioxygenase [Anaerolineales bacterium]HRJ55748.1 VOC family protein [Anaerolineales bacterium]HRK88090.1 VOC family protein [Anaerolineales bacterium]
MITPSPMKPHAIAADRIHPESLPGYIHIKVANLENQILFYKTAIGLELNWRKDQIAAMGMGGRDLVRMTQIQNGKRYRGVTGMYHFAILFPNRRELARVIARLFAMKYTNYPTDHIMTKTTYLDDPEGNNIELYCESPEDGVNEISNGNFFVRRADGSTSDGREAMDLDALFSNLTEDDRLDLSAPPETRMGHFHLYTANLNDTLRFYHDVLGFDDMGTARGFRMGMVSAGAYHHHIGYNTWQGEGAPPPPDDALGLLYYTFNLPNADELERMDGLLEQKGIAFERRPDGLFLRDPSQNALLLTTAELAESTK